jgi:sulfate permease, SulP family
VLDFEGIGTLDATALDALGDLLHGLVELDVEVVAVARANHDVMRRLRRADLVEPLGPLRSFPTINSAVHAFRTSRRV